MTTLEFNTRKLEFVKEFLNEEDEALVQDLITFFVEAKDTATPIPGVPRTFEELKAAVAHAEEDLKQGNGIPHEEVFENILSLPQK
jgi:hypothetical protein